MTILKKPLAKFDFLKAKKRVSAVVRKTPLEYNNNLSKRYGADIYLKREDLQIVRSYKLRGAYNLMRGLPGDKLRKGVVCASAGNHAQGFAYSCKILNVQGVVFMPVITPNQKRRQTKMFGGDNIEIRLIGDNYDECAMAAKDFAKEKGLTFVHAFDDARIIEGQATVGMEILEELTNIDYLFLPIGGGGLASGAGTYFKNFSPSTLVIGVEPEGAPSMFEAFKAGKPVTLNHIETFVDGASVKRTGELTYSICREVLDDLHLVPEGKVCTSILQLYNEDAIVAEPAGALAVSALDDFAEEIKGKKVVCVISGGNNDIDRMQEIKERSLQYEGLKYYFLIRFTQRAGVLREFVNDILGPSDDITRFEYIKKTNKESGPALVGIEVKCKKDYDQLIKKLRSSKISYTELKNNEDAFNYLV